MFYICRTQCPASKRRDAKELCPVRADSPAAQRSHASVACRGPKYLVQRLCSLPNEGHQQLLRGHARIHPSPTLRKQQPLRN